MNNNIKREKKQCKNCGKVFWAGRGEKRTRAAQHCNDTCRREYAKKGRTRFRKICLYCDNEYTTIVKKQKYCSSECAHFDKRTLRGTTRNCVVCGEDFEPTYEKAKCCSTECARTKAHETMSKQDVEKKCDECGRIFEVDGFHRFARFCSRRCRDANWSRSRRGKVRDSYVEDVSLDYIYKRDAEICQICGERVGLSYSFPHPRSATLDHIVPLSKGGEHSKKNCQLAHWECNNNKGTGSVNSQLRLMG